MMNFHDWIDGRRLGPRVGVGSLCSEHTGARERHALVTDLSASGLRIARPYLAGALPRELTLEFEVPEVDEVVWARGEVCFDRVTQAAGDAGGAFGLVRTTGVRIVRAAARDLRLLRDVAYELWRHQARAEDPAQHLALASCYARG